MSPSNRPGDLPDDISERLSAQLQSSDRLIADARKQTSRRIFRENVLAWTRGSADPELVELRAALERGDIDPLTASRHPAFARHARESTREALSTADLEALREQGRLAREEADEEVDREP